MDRSGNTTTLVVATNSAGIDQDVSLATFDPSFAALYVTGTDSLGNVSTVETPVEVDSGPLLTEIMSAFGEVFDSDLDHALYVDSTGLRVLFRDHCDNDTLESPSSAVDGKLTPHGAIVRVNADATGATLVEWRDGLRLDHGRASISPHTLNVAGAFVEWHEAPPNDRTIHRLNTDSGVEDIVTTDASNTSSDLASDGTVSYTSISTFLVHRWLDGKDVTLGPGGETRTDGSFVLSATAAGSTCTTTLWDTAGNEETLATLPFSACLAGFTFQVAAGRTVYIAPDSNGVTQAFTRDASGTRTQITSSATNLLLEPGPSADSLLVQRQSGIPRKELVSGSSLLPVGTLGASVDRGGHLLIPIGRTVFGVGEVPPCTTADCSVGCDGGGIRPHGGGADAGVDAPPDAVQDATVPDAAAPDAAMPDAAVPDAGTPDAAILDAPVADASVPDSRLDANVPADANGGPRHDGCQSGPGSSGGWMIALLLGLVMRRRLVG